MNGSKETRKEKRNVEKRGQVVIQGRYRVIAGAWLVRVVTSSPSVSHRGRLVCRVQVGGEVRSRSRHPCHGCLLVHEALHQPGGRASGPLGAGWAGATQWSGGRPQQLSSRQEWQVASGRSRLPLKPGR